MLAGLRTLRDLSRQSRDMFEDLERDGFDCGYRRSGVINVCRTRREFERLKADVELLQHEGFEPRLLDAAEARRLEPSLLPEIQGGAYWTEDGHCSPGLFVAEVARRAEQRGAQLHLGTRVLGFQLSNDGSIDAVLTTGGALRPRSVVLAAGSWSAGLARLAGTRLPVQAGKGYHVQLADGAPQLERPVIFQESVFAATPIGSALRLAGTMEFVGTDLRLSVTRAARLLSEARLYLAGLDTPGAYTVWCGLRPCTPDGLPILGWSTRVPNLLLATGHAMLGLTLAPITGRIVADLIRAGSIDVPIGPLSPARYRA
jgi:D-amino-acid dehydrogenase